MEQLLCGIDVGTTSTKAALFSLDGQVAAVHNAGYPTHHIQPAWVEQHPEDWWAATCTALQQVIAAVPHARERIAGLAVSSQAPAMIPLDKNGQVLRPALIWMDRRAEIEAQQLAEELGADEVFRITGNRPDTYYAGAKFRWFAKHEPELLAKTHQFVQVNGYINYRLTGTYTVDNSHSGLSQLANYGTETWSDVMCAACGFDPAQLPPIRPGHTIQGEVTSQAAKETGLRPGTPVMVGAVDACAAILEAGVTEAGSAAEMTGTSTVVIMPNTTGLTEAALIAMPHALPDVHLLLGATVASGASLNWYRDQFGLPEQQASTLLDMDTFDLLNRQAEQSPPGSDGVIFLPYMMGERSPLWHTHARGVLFGLSLATSRGAVIRAILEGTAFSLLHNIEVAQAAGATVWEMRAVGGGTRSHLWNQIKADVLGIPILLPEASIGAPFGDAMLVGVGLGLYPDIQQTLREIVQIKTVYEPNPANHALYRELYGVFRDVYQHLRDDFDHAAAIYAGHKG